METTPAVCLQEGELEWKLSALRSLSWREIGRGWFGAQGRHCWVSGVSHPCWTWRFEEVSQG